MMLTWYYSEVLRGLIAIWRYFLQSVVLNFSLVQLLKTLFAPWRRDTAPPTGSLDQRVRIMIENLVSRFVGFCVRFLTILAALLILVLVFLLGCLALSLFLIFPFTGIGTLVVMFAYQDKINKEPPISRPLSELIASINEIEAEKLLPYLEYSARQIYQKSQDYQTLLVNLSQNQRVRFILNRLGLSGSLLSDFKGSQLMPAQILKRAAQITKGERIAAPQLFLACFLEDERMKEYFQKMHIKEEDVETVSQWEEAFYRATHPVPVWFSKEGIRTSGGVARLWSAGYTPNLDRYSHDIGANIASQNPLHFEAHKDKIKEAEAILAKTGKHNLILVGEPGTGKRNVALGLASEIVFGETSPLLAHHRVIEFNLDALLAGTSGLGEAEERLVLSLQEALRAGDIILFVDNIERLFEQGEGKTGALDLSATLLPYLESPDFRLIGTTTYEGYHKWIETNPRLSSSFEKIEIKEPNAKETLKILQEIAIYLESKYRVFILYQALVAVVSLSERYFGDKKFPEKAIDLLDEACSFVLNQKKKMVLEAQDVEELVGIKTHIPVAEASKEEAEKLLHLEEMIHQRLINQKEAVKEIAESLRRARAGIRPENRPIGSFLFLGPTGVGKTETAKTLAELYFGDENQMLRFDMSEFQSVADIPRLIGGKAEEPGILTSKVREKPFSLLLLDEIEKAHPNILNLFLQVLDEGHLTDSLGRTVDFKNTIIIATSNAGSEWIREAVKQGLALDKESFLDYLQKQNLFRPEFLNRFDAVVAFRPLNQVELEQVVEIMLRKLSKQLSQKQIKIFIEPQAKKTLAQIGFDPQFGARALRRAVQEKVENKIAQAILEKKLTPGSQFIITEKMLQG